MVQLNTWAGLEEVVAVAHETPVLIPPRSAFLLSDISRLGALLKGACYCQQAGSPPERCMLLPANGCCGGLGPVQARAHLKRCGRGTITDTASRLYCVEVTLSSSLSSSSSLQVSTCLLLLLLLLVLMMVMRLHTRAGMRCACS